MLTMIVLMVMMICVIVLTIFIAKTLNSLQLYLLEKEKKTRTETLGILNENKEKISFDDTDQLFSIINFIIENEISYRVKLLSYSKSSYKMLNLDKDISDISTTVFNELNKDIFDTSKLMVTSDYVMHYIVNQITLKLAGSMNEYNLLVSRDSESDN